MTRRKVLWLTKGLGRGGAEQLLVTGAAHLDASRFEVDVAYLLPWKDALVPRLTDAGVRVHCLGQSSSADPRWVTRLRRLLHHGAYDLVHTHMPIPAVAARLVAGRRAVVHTEHNVWQRYRRPTYWANAVTYRRNDAVLAVSASVLASVPPRFLPRSPATAEVLLHGVQHDALHAGAEARAHARGLLGLEDGVFVVGSVGNLTAKKDQSTLLRAMQAVRVTRPDAVLVLVGTGPLEAELRAEVQRLGLDAAVHMLGSRDDVPELLPGFDVFCLSSLHEGLPIAMLEAMGSGIPAVCTRVGGIAEALRDGVDGLLVPPGDPQALAQALRQLAVDPDLRDRLAAGASARSQEFDIRSAVRRMEDVYDEVLARR